MGIQRILYGLAIRAQKIKKNLSNKINMDFGVIVWKGVIIGILILIVRIWRNHKEAIIAELKRTFKREK